MTYIKQSTDIFKKDQPQPPSEAGPDEEAPFLAGWFGQSNRQLEEKK